ncbi:MAG TPA: mismatch-specific DNA-glycosylase [Dehalococcoidia bacterium]|nr:mismatch-specific DNA-glycosylase [Dehalococcoidia bacterium]
MDEFTTLPDYLAPGLDLVLVGINPSAYSVRVGHYFANPRNRFWEALNRSGIVGRALAPEEDSTLLQYGIGLTDVVKRPTPQTSSLKAADYRQWCPVLRQKLLEYQPVIACFHGLTGYKAFLKYGEESNETPALGRQARTIGKTRLFVIPNPSPANAQYSMDDLVHWYRQLGQFRQELIGGAN